MSIPARPALRPGRHVLRREPDTLQVGLDPARALRLPDSPVVRRTLAAVRVGGPRDRGDPGVLAALADAGLLVEARDLRGPHGVVAEHGRDAAEVLRRRSSVQVRVDVFGLTPLPDASGLLRAAGLQVAAPPDLVLVAGVGEPARERLDPWVRSGVPHLVLRISEGEAVVGPFVVPGRTACLRCIDAHLTDDDPRWPLLVAQQAEQTARPRADGAAEPVDPALAQLAVAWAVRDLTAHADCLTPATWSATVRLPAQLADTESVAWLRHPGCGCWWNTSDIDRSGSGSQAAWETLSG